MKGKESDDEKLYYDSYNSEDLEKVIATQHKVILHMKKQTHSHLFSIWIIVDDFADSPEFSRQKSVTPQSLYERPP